MRGRSWACVPGPLQRYVPGFGVELERQGYLPQSVRWQLQLAGHLNAWLAGRGMAAAALTPSVVEDFLAGRRAAGYRMFRSPKALAPLLAYLRLLGVPPVAVAAELSSVESLLERYRRYLVVERGLVLKAARGYVDLVRPFVCGREGVDGVDLDGLAAGDVT